MNKLIRALIFFVGGKDGPVGFADFVYKHIVPACFLAPLKQTFDLADAQTVLVGILSSDFIEKLLDVSMLFNGNLPGGKLKLGILDNICCPENMAVNFHDL